MKVISLFGGSTKQKSLVVTSQRRLNCYYDNRPDQDKTKVAIFGTPGLVAAFTAGSGQPMRAMGGTDNTLYAIAYNQFLALNPVNGVTLASGTLNTFSSHAEMAISPTQVVIVDGNSGYLWTIATNVLTVISPWQATGAQTVTFVSGFFVAEQPGTQNFWVSNAFDGSTWNALAFAAAAADSDTILAVDQLNGNLIIFMTQGMQFFVNQGLFPEPFVPLPSAANTFGLAAIASRVHADQALLFLSETTQGTVQAARLDGYNVTIISNGDVEAIWNSFSVVEDAVGLTYQRDTHIFYQLTFPTANRSFLYDCSTRLWNETQTGTSLFPVRHTANIATYSAGRMLLADYATAQIYTMSDTQYTDNGVTIIREVITKHVLSQFNRVRISLLYLDMETGVGLQTGQGSNPQIMLQSSKDNGRTWSAERWTTLGAVGAYMTRVVWRRFGSARDYVFKIRMSDPVKFVVTEGAIKIAERPPAEKMG
jgi:Phage stabilisation protein